MASKFTLPPTPPLVHSLNKLQSLTFEPSESDVEDAYELICQYREAKTSQRWTLSNSVRAKDATAVMEQISQGLVPTATPGLVLALIVQFGADVCVTRPKSSNLIKIAKGKDQVEVRSTSLEQAVRNCSDEIAYIMANYADETALNWALPTAMSTGQSIKVIILMQKGADASRLCPAFLQIVSTGPDDLLEKLLKFGSKGSCQTCRDRGLVEAAVQGFENKAGHLLKSGADVSFDNANALFAATRGGMELLAAQMVTTGSGARVISAPILNKIVGLAYERQQFRLLEACLKNGVKGTTTDKVLVEAVRSQQSSLVDSLVQQGASISHEGGASLQLAVRSGDTKLLRSLLKGATSTATPGIVTTAMLEVAKLSDPSIAYEMMNMLLTANVHGDTASAALLQVLESASLGGDMARAPLVQLLLSKGRADINTQEGKCVSLAVSNGWTETFGLLVRCRPTFDALRYAMHAAMTVQDPPLRLSLIEVLLRTNPATNPNDTVGARNSDTKGSLVSSAFQAAAQALLLDVMQVVAAKPRQLTEADYIAAWRAATALEQNGRWLTPEGSRIIMFLFKKGVTGEIVEDAFCKAVVGCYQEAVELLGRRVQNGPTISKALYLLAEQPQVWHSDDNIWLIRLLLSRGCDAHSVNNALLAAVRAFASGPGSEIVVKVLLMESSSADVNFQNGDIISAAVAAGNVSLLKLLLSKDVAERSVMTRAFTTAITTPLEEKTSISLLQVLVGPQEKDGVKKKLRFDLNSPLSRGLSPIAACLDSNPGHARLVKRLIKLGCDVQAEFQFKLYDEKGIGEEATTVLLWACRSQGKSSVSAEVIETLLAAKANVNFATPKSRATPLILASKSCRGDIVARLLSANANAKARDCFSLTPLFYAARAGDVLAVKELGTKSNTDDGSLHEAARNLHSEVVALLIKAKHNVDFPCTKAGHAGRTALQELCAKSDGLRDEDALENTIRALCGAKFDVFGLYGHMNALFLALENVINPVPVTRTLLDVVMWKHIEDERNVFETQASPLGTREYFSPTKFLDSRFFKGDPQRISTLKDLLYFKRCPDRYYVSFGPGEPGALQPVDAVGYPKHIEDEQRERLKSREKQRIKDFEHDNELRRKKEESEYKEMIRHREHRQQLDLSNATHQTKLGQQQAMTQQQFDALERKRTLAISMHRDAEANKMNMAMISAQAKGTPHHKASGQQMPYYQQPHGAQMLAIQENSEGRTRDVRRIQEI